jgi:hypothetical protein
MMQEIQSFVCFKFSPTSVAVVANKALQGTSSKPHSGFAAAPELGR